MNEDYYNSEIYSLNREIHRLNKQLEEEKKRYIPDKLDPFDNPTEYTEFSGDYSDIMPEIENPECEIPLEPDNLENKAFLFNRRVGSSWTVSYK